MKHAEGFVKYSSLLQYDLALPFHVLLHSNIHETFYIEPFYALSKGIVYLAHCVVVIGICHEHQYGPNHTDVHYRPLRTLFLYVIMSSERNIQKKEDIQGKLV